ncbi:MAG: glycoside hydrolase family 32 protein [Candidatus Symbiothrix sp.]|jgi:beta-fructofuranosidase|nr:glycoside hydrolase family 32 protein [Candidatus Symbiothrix sp.]
MRLSVIFLFLFGLLQGTSAQYDAGIDTLAKNSLELRYLKHSDPHRPIYHFLCPDGYGQPFDPNGAIFWNGKYHLGYIYQTDRNGKWKHLWGHAVSTDLFHWTLYPDMLDVKTGDIENGIFSGGTFISRQGIPYIMYHGEGSATNLIAHSTDRDLENWIDKTPVLVTPKEGDPMFGKYVAWDPEGWYDKTADTYYQISGGNPASFFKSGDLKTWQYLGDFIDPAERRNNAFEDISCPDFFKIGNKNVLLFISHYMGAQYYIGTFANDKFKIEKHGRMNWPGGTFFAPEQLIDDKGRNIIWSWILERKPAHLKNFGWSGIMSLPRVLSLSEDDELQINPPEEVKRIRINEQKEKNQLLDPHSEYQLAANGKYMEIQMELMGGQKSPYGLKVFCSPDKREETLIQYDPVAEELIIDFRKSSVHAPVEFPQYCMTYYPPETDVEGIVSEQRASFKLQKGENLQLDVFIDRSVIEVFANGRQCVTQVVYPELPESDGIVIFSGSETVHAKNITTWEMSATNPY